MLYEKSVNGFDIAILGNNNMLGYTNYSVLRTFICFLSTWWQRDSRGTCTGRESPVSKQPPQQENTCGIDLLNGLFKNV